MVGNLYTKDKSFEELREPKTRGGAGGGWAGRVKRQFSSPTQGNNRPQTRTAVNDRKKRVIFDRKWAKMKGPVKQHEVNVPGEKDDMSDFLVCGGPMILKNRKKERAQIGRVLKPGKRVLVNSRHPGQKMGAPRAGIGKTPPKKKNQRPVEKGEGRENQPER